MIEHTTGDILRADTDAVVNTVNCVGVMGRGIALQFKHAYPENFAFYAKACATHQVQPGHMLVFETRALTGPRYVINFPTKRHWRGASRMEDIEAGLVALVADVLRLGLRSVSIPPLGSGLGGLDWRQVRPRIEAAFASLPSVRVLIFEPGGAPPAEAMEKPKKAPKMTSGRAALVGLMRRYLDGLMDPSVSLLEVHKLMYFMQEAGQPLRLSYTKALYGPYAENLRHVLREIEGHFISGYADGGDTPDKQLELVPGVEADAEKVLARDHATQKNLDRVGALVDGFETPFGLELLATVHWVAKHESAKTPAEAVARVHAWSERKQRFAPAQIELAFRTLAAQGWIA
jgi:O-acetyl-ADP-ribose deacetylase (regulator of RNase III)